LYQYVVQVGDTAAEISQRFGVSWERIREASKAISPSLRVGSLVFPGMRLQIPLGGGLTTEAGLQDFFNPEGTPPALLTNPNNPQAAANRAAQDAAAAAAAAAHGYEAQKKKQQQELLIYGVVLVFVVLLSRGGR
jgi:LysM domain-containing protein